MFFFAFLCVCGPYCTRSQRILLGHAESHLLAGRGGGGMFRSLDRPVYSACIRTPYTFGRVRARKSSRRILMVSLQETHLKSASSLPGETEGVEGTRNNSIRDSCAHDTAANMQGGGGRRIERGGFS